MDDTTTLSAPPTTSVDDRMRADGIEPMESVQTDYFAFDETGIVTLPDGKSIIEFKMMNEGMRRQYLSKVNRDVRIHRQSGDMALNLDPAADKKALLETVISGWNLIRGGQPVPFSKPNLALFLEKAPPSVIDHIDTAIRKAHPWMTNEMTLEDVDAELARLADLRKEIIEREAGKAA